MHSYRPPVTAVAYVAAEQVGGDTSTQTCLGQFRFWQGRDALTVIYPNDTIGHGSSYGDLNKCWNLQVSIFRSGPVHL